MRRFIFMLLAAAAMLTASSCGAEKESVPEIVDEKTETIEAPEIRDPNEPLSPDGGEAEAGYTNLSSQFIKLSTPFVIDDIYKCDMEISGDSLYLLSGNSFAEYHMMDNRVSLVRDITLSKPCTRINIDYTGRICLSRDLLSGIILNDDGTETEMPIGYLFALSETDDFGLSYRGADDVIRHAGGLEKTWVLNNMPDNALRGGPMQSINYIDIVNGHALVVGVAADYQGQKLAVYDYDGSRIAESYEKIFGNWATAATEISRGYITASEASITLFDDACMHAGDIKNAKKLFGINYGSISINKMIPQPDGSIFMLVGAQRSEDISEALVYRVSLN